MLDLCRARRLTLATAESCTGGLIAARLTDVPGASDVFRGASSRTRTTSRCGSSAFRRRCSPTHGAVSAETAAAMAAGARERLNVDVAVAVTGVAGPGGGTPEKPVGLVFLHASGPDGDDALRFEFPGERDWIRPRSAVAALHLVRRLLDTEPARRRMSSAATLEGDATLRLFLALRLPDETIDALARWGDTALPHEPKQDDRRAARRVPPEHLHVTLAFLGGRPASELPGIVDALRAAAAGSDPFSLVPVRYRETRSVGMVVLEDPTGKAGTLAAGLHDRLARLGVYRPETRCLARRTSPSCASTSVPVCDRRSTA